MTEDLFADQPAPEPTPTCGRCVHHDLKTGGLGDHGYGQCTARPEPFRSAVFTSEACTCRIGKFRQKQ